VQKIVIIDLIFTVMMHCLRNNNNIGPQLCWIAAHLKVFVGGAHVIAGAQDAFEDQGKRERVVDPEVL
jgi:hypothetical protein